MNTVISMAHTFAGSYKLTDVANGGAAWINNDGSDWSISGALYRLCLPPRLLVSICCVLDRQWEKSRQIT